MIGEDTIFYWISLKKDLTELLDSSHSATERQLTKRMSQVAAESVAVAQIMIIHINSGGQLNLLYIGGCRAKSHSEDLEEDL